MKHKQLFFISVFILGLQGCAGTAQPQKFVPVNPGQAFTGSYMNITTPNSDGWKLAQSSLGMSFGKVGPAPNQSFGAQVLGFGLAATNTPQEFETLVMELAKKDIDPSRYVVQRISFKYSNERSYPCVRCHYVVQDKSPQGLKIPLLLEAEALYCRHPMRQETGFAIIFSHRGDNL